MSTNPNIDDGGSAFPQHGWSSNPEVLERMKNQGGMSLRDWFAGMALQALIVNPKTTSVHCPISIRAYELADAMLNKRDADMNK